MGTEILVTIVGAGSALGTVIVNRLFSKKQDHLTLLTGMQDKWYKEIGRLEEKIRVLESKEEEAKQQAEKLTKRIEELEVENRKQAQEIKELKVKLNEKESTKSNKDV